MKMEAPTQAYELTFEERPLYLFARVKAETIDRGTAIVYLRQLSSERERIGATRVMLDRQTPSVLSDADNYFIVHEIMEMLPVVKLAVVNPFEINDEGLTFGLLVSTNRGAMYRAFRTEAEAEAWLID